MLIALDDELPTEADQAEGAFLRQMKRRRTGLGLSQGDLAERVVALGGAMYQQTVAKLEAGQRALKLSEADLIARAMGTTVQSMLSADLGVIASGDMAKLSTLKELEVARREVEERLKLETTKLVRAKMSAMQAITEREAAEVAATAAQMRVAEMNARCNDLREELEYLQMRIGEHRAAGESLRRDATLDAVLEEAEPSLDALDGVVGGRGEESDEADS